MDPRFARHVCPASRLHYLDGGGGPPVVLVHGLGWDGARLWAAQMGALVDAGWRVLVPDLRGTGASPPLRAAVGVRGLAADLVALIGGLGLARPALVGFSMGAMVVAAVAEDVPPRGVVMACGGLAATAEGEAATEAMLARATALGPLGFATEQADAIFGAQYAAAQPQAVQDFIRWRAAMDQTSLHHAFRAPFGADLTGAVAALPCPVHLFAADQDRFLPLPAMQALAQRVGASLTVIADSGHMAPVEQPAAFTAALLAALERT